MCPVEVGADYNGGRRTGVSEHTVRNENVNNTRYGSSQL